MNVCRGIAFAGMVGVAVPTSFAESPPGAITGVEREALLESAARHANQTGLDRGLVERAMFMQAGSGNLAEEIRRDFSDRFATMYRLPPDRLVVRLKGHEPVRPRLYLVGSDLLKVDFTLGAKHTTEELLEAMARMEPQLDRLVPTLIARYVDEKTGEIVVIASDRSQINSERIPCELLGVPIRFDFVGDTTGYGSSPPVPR